MPWSHDSDVHALPTSFYLSVLCDRSLQVRTWPLLYLFNTISYETHRKCVYSVGFEANVIVVFQEGYMITENFSLNLFR